jgi:hypothetical protein
MGSSNHREDDGWERGPKEAGSQDGLWWYVGLAYLISAGARPVAIKPIAVMARPEQSRHSLLLYRAVKNGSGPALLESQG